MEKNNFKSLAKAIILSLGLFTTSSQLQSCLSQGDENNTQTESVDMTQFQKAMEGFQITSLSSDQKQVLINIVEDQIKKSSGNVYLKVDGDISKGYTILGDKYSGVFDLDSSYGDLTGRRNYGIDFDTGVISVAPFGQPFEAFDHQSNYQLFLEPAGE